MAGRVITQAELDLLQQRRERALSQVDVSRGHGLELGALDRPIVRRSDGEVYYVDVTDTAGVREHYKNDPNVHIDSIVDVDFPLILNGITRSLAEASAPKAPYDWIVASHVIEHVPDLVGFLRDLESLLTDGGRVALIVPDRRYCFDAMRPPTTLGDVLLAHANGDTRPSLKAVFDFYNYAVHGTSQEFWNGKVPEQSTPMHDVNLVMNTVQRYRDSGDYIDTHAWLFTPDSFVDQLRALFALGLSNLTVTTIEPTPVGDLEFFATLTLAPRDLDDAARAELAQSSFPPIPGDPPRGRFGPDPLLVRAEDQIAELTERNAELRRHYDAMTALRDGEQARADELAGRLDTVLSSKSWRIGRALTTPIRFLRGDRRPEG
jgi:hypothetical protein